MPAPGQPIAVHPALKAGKRTKPLPAGMQSLPLKDAKLVGGTPPKTSPTKASPASTCRSDIVQYTPRGTNVIKPSGINRSGGAGAIDSREAAEIMTHVRGKLSAHYDEKELARLSRQLNDTERQEREAQETARKQQEKRVVDPPRKRLGRHDMALAWAGLATW